MQRARAALTLIELMIALALTIMIILVATATFRVVARSIQRMQQMSVENELLRLGVEMVLDDADFGHSDANPEEPYDKDYRREPRSDHFRTYKRPFLKMVFSQRTDPAAPHFATADLPSQLTRVPNPNALLPHDPRGWYRGWWFVDSRSPGAERHRYISVHGDYSLVTATDMRGARHREGSTGGGGSWPAGTALLDPEVLALGEHLPLLQAATYLELAGIGPMAYGPPGVGPAPMDHKGNRPSNDNGRLPSAPYGYQSSPLPFRGSNGTVGDGHRYDLSTLDNDTINDFESGLGLNLGSAVGAIAFPPSNRRATIAQVDSQLFTNATFDTNVSQFGRYIVATGPSLRDMSRSDSNFMGTLLRNHNYLSETIRLPYNISDAHLEGTPIDYETLPQGYPVMSTGIARYHGYLAGQLVVCKVALMPQGGGDPQELWFTPLTSDFRALRQHWRLVPPPPGGPEAGDFYQ